MQEVRYDGVRVAYVLPGSVNTGFGGLSNTKSEWALAPDDVAEVAQSMLQPFPLDEYPNLLAFITEHAMKPGYDYGDEFEYGLDLILDGLERLRDTASPRI